MPLYTSADDDNIFEGSGLMSYVWHVLIALDLRLVPAPQGEACGIVRVVSSVVYYYIFPRVLCVLLTTVEGVVLYLRPWLKAVLEVITLPQRSVTQPLHGPTARPYTIRYGGFISGRMVKP